MTEEIADMKKRLLSFRAFADGATPEVLVTLIQTLVERIYIQCMIMILPSATFLLKAVLPRSISDLLGPSRLHKCMRGIFTACLSV